MLKEKLAAAKDANPSTDFNTKDPSSRSGFKEHLEAVIKEKERVLKETNPSGLKKQLWDTEHTRNLAESIMFYYSARKVCNMYLVNVIDHIMRTQTNFKKNKKDICEGINYLCELFDGTWLSVITLANEEGDILRINKMFPFDKVIEKIKSVEGENK